MNDFYSDVIACVFYVLVCLENKHHLCFQTNPSDVFFIDTQPKRSKLSLPEPQQNKSDLIQEEATEPATPLNHEAAKPKEDDSVRPSPVDATPSVQPLGRVMKRRNQDLYTINPEDY